MSSREDMGATGLTVPSPQYHSIERPWNELHVGMHLGSGVQGQTSALEAVSCPPHCSRCSISWDVFVVLPFQTLKDVIQIPLFKLLK